MGSCVLLQFQIHWGRATEAKGTELCESHTSLRRDPGVVCSLSATDLLDYCWQKNKENVLDGLQVTKMATVGRLKNSQWRLDFKLELCVIKIILDGNSRFSNFFYMTMFTTTAPLNLINHSYRGPRLDARGEKEQGAWFCFFSTSQD